MAHLNNEDPLELLEPIQVNSYQIPGARYLGQQLPPYVAEQVHMVEARGPVNGTMSSKRMIYAVEINPSSLGASPNDEMTQIAQRVQKFNADYCSPVWRYTMKTL